MNILLAVDGSDYTKRMLAYLTTHDDMFTPQQQFTLFTAQSLIPLRARAALGTEVVAQYHREEAEKILAPASKFLVRHGMDPKSDWEAGNAGETIAKFAQTGKFDLVIMGSHGHGALANLVMGSVATQVLANCTVPVLLVR